MSRHAARAAAIVAAALTLTALASPVAATHAGANGRIVFTRDGDIWTADPDLSDDVMVTSGGFPSWSPDGTRIAFQRNTDPDPGDDQEIQDIFTARADGSDVRRITPTIGDSEKAQWSPDGRWLVFSSDAGDYPAGQGIYLIRSDGSGAMRMLTPKPAGTFFAELARFSPDGSQVLFTAYRGSNSVQNSRQDKLSAFASALFVVNVDGTGVRQLTAWGVHAQDGDWSPDGRQIVFTSSPPHAGNVADVMVMDRDGRRVRNLSQDHGLTGSSGTDGSVRYAESFNAVWSPDGSRILFVHASFTSDDGFRLGLQTMAPDGSQRDWVTDGLGFEHQPEWGTAPIVP